jgi:hypothetical protein
MDSFEYPPTDMEIMKQETQELNQYDNVKDVLDNWLKFGTMMAIERVMSYYLVGIKNATSVFDKSWLLTTVFTLLGFSLYFILVRHVIPNKFGNVMVRNVLDDLLLNGTMLAASHVMVTYLGGGDSDGLFNKEWIMTTGFILLGFTVYNAGTSQILPQDKLNETTKPLVNDWAKFATMLTVVRVLRGKSLLNKKWVLGVLFTLIGFTAYHLITKKAIKFM